MLPSLRTARANAPETNAGQVSRLNCAKVVSLEYPSTRSKNAEAEVECEIQPRSETATSELNTAISWCSEPKRSGQHSLWPMPSIADSFA